MQYVGYIQLTSAKWQKLGYIYDINTPLLDLNYFFIVCSLTVTYLLLKGNKKERKRLLSSEDSFY